MMKSLKFVHISDIHISKNNEASFLVTEDITRFFKETIELLNILPALDFVFISGDCLNSGREIELFQFQQILAQLEKPVFIVPGNHDGNVSDAPNVFTQRRFASIFNPQYAERPQNGQAGYFSISVKDDFQLIGLDTSIPGQVEGQIDDEQLAWLETELKRHADKFIIVGFHHPLHPLCEKSKTGLWKDMFVCQNGKKVQKLLDTYKSVKIVLCGHHHISKAFSMGSQLHLASPPLASFPCGYRIIHLTEHGDDWRINWKTNYAPAFIRSKAATQLITSQFALEYDAENPHNFIKLARGSQFDQTHENQLRQLQS